MKRLGKYDVVEVLGKGSMGVVYKGFDPAIERHVALKTIRKELIEREQYGEFFARFTNEARAGGRLTHPGIVAVYEYGEDDDTAYIAMEFVQGRGLRDYFVKHERFGLQDVMNIMGQLLDALDYAHQSGVVHRDIKPANLIVTAEGRLKIADFGIARLDSSNITQVGAFMGTPSYMSPEQFAGLAVDRRSDIFSAGVVLYELLTGSKPFQGPTETVSYKVCHEEQRNPSEINPEAVPATFDAVIARALAKDREQRFQSAREFADALLHAYESSGAATAGNEATILNAASGDAPPSGRPETTTYPPSAWPVEELRALEHLLAPCVGPLAKVLVKRAAKSATEGVQLVSLLSEHIADPNERSAFVAAALSKVSASESDSRPGTSTRKELDPAEIEKAVSCLALYLGPVARIVVKKAAARNPGKKSFYSSLAQSIADPEDRARFLRDAGFT